MLPIRLSLLSLAVALAACATASGPRFGHPGEPDAAQRAQLKAAEQAYRAEAKAEALAADPKAAGGKVDPAAPAPKPADGKPAEAQSAPAPAKEGQPKEAQPSAASPEAPKVEFAVLRDALAKDPVTAFWLTRLFVRDLLLVREARQESQESQDVAAKQVRSVVRAADGGPADAKLLQSVLKARDPLETRALAQIDAMGAAAVPCIVNDLAGHKQAFVRQLGAELVGRIGAPALPAIAQLAASRDPVLRRSYAQCMASLSVPEADFATLRAMAIEDGDFTVRAAAIDAMAQRDPGGMPLIRQRLVRDEDPFVRRVAARALALERSQENAIAIADFLDRSMRDRDSQSERAAQEALQQMAKTRGPRTLELWRQFAQSLPAAPK